MKIKMKKLHPEAVLPKHQREGDAGADLVAISHEYEMNDSGRELQVYGTGLAVEIPKGHVGLIFPRSSISKTALSLTNSVGVIDSNYRGEIKFKFALEDNARPAGTSVYKAGDRIGQLVIVPYVTIEAEEVQELDETIRGTSGFGSSGR